MGYIKHSMSERAAEAYERGEKPFSKWLKSELLSEIKSTYGEEAEGMAKRLSIGDIKGFFLVYSSYHHTSKFYSRTNFYKFNDKWTSEEVKAYLSKPREKQKPTKEAEEVKHCALVSFKVWEGTRKHPKAVIKKGVAVWTTRGDKNTLAKIDTFFKSTWNEYKNIKSLTIIEELKKYPRKNSKIWRLF